MRLARHPKLDALCGEYLLGTLRAGARRRFEDALEREPFVAQRFEHWQQVFAITPARAIEVDPSPDVWTRLQVDLKLPPGPAKRAVAPHAPSWFDWVGLWRGWAIAATAALVIAVALPQVERMRATPQAPIATLAATSGPAAAVVTAALSRDGRTLELRAARPVVAGPQQSYELWLVPAEGGAAISLAVLGSLDARLRVPDAQVGRLRAGAKLAVSVEPAGGSPTGAATGPVILLGAIGA